MLAPGGESVVIGGCMAMGGESVVVGATPAASAVQRAPLPAPPRAPPHPCCVVDGCEENGMGAANNCGIARGGGGCCEVLGRAGALMAPPPQQCRSLRQQEQQQQEERQQEREQPSPPLAGRGGLGEARTAGGATGFQLFLEKMLPRETKRIGDGGRPAGQTAAELREGEDDPQACWGGCALHDVAVASVRVLWQALGAQQRAAVAERACSAAAAAPAAAAAAAAVVATAAASASAAAAAALKKGVPPPMPLHADNGRSRSAHSLGRIEDIV